ncbi:hypothetical protein NM688_g773 [Phlebia brevispora]|uniref:Uncharacterized protein n=1 Tax=Phlebia brevispora TaxID=194682 RepID=A0ACC1TDM0_9APHY|nr:hypothetical protein NM688_g773 [Phlebia brevispora]
MKLTMRIGLTDRISLESFYPFLAWLGALGHTVLPHFALQYRIVNNPSPSNLPIKCEDDWTAKVLIVDDRAEPLSWTQSNTTSFLAWCPKAESEAVAKKLFKRIFYDGHVLPILTAIAFSILAEMYTTTSGADRKNRRVRLQYSTSPIADFGIARGAVAVDDEHLFAFCRRSDRSITRGQDPKNHYWLWFKTIRNQEIILDLSMLPFDMCTLVATEEYVPSSVFGEFQVDPLVPALFYDREMRKESRQAPIKAQLHNTKESIRVSALYDEDLEEAVAYSHDRANYYPADEACIGKFMARVAGKEVTKEERKLAYDFTNLFGGLLEKNLRLRVWETSPTTPQTGFYLDAGERDSFDERVRDFWSSSSSQGRSSTQRQGASSEQLAALIRALHSCQVGERQDALR